MDSEIQQKLSKLGEKVDAIWVSVEKTRKYFLITMWVTVITFVLPLIILAFIIPSFISSYASTLNIDSLNTINSALAP